MDLFPFLLGGLGGVLWALVGAKYHQIGNSDFEFNFSKFFKTVVIGAAVGAASVYYGQPVDLFATTATSATITAFVDRVINLVWKWYSTR